jgi:hypothetical protein
MRKSEYITVMADAASEKAMQQNENIRVTASAKSEYIIHCSQFLLRTMREFRIQQEKLPLENYAREPD